jgi:hypothetical protein
MKRVRLGRLKAIAGRAGSADSTDSAGSIASAESESSATDVAKGPRDIRLVQRLFLASGRREMGAGAGAEF